MIGSAALGIFLYASGPSTLSSSTSTSNSSTVSGGQSTITNGSSASSSHFKIVYDNLVVGFNSGLWEFKFQDVSGRSITMVTAVLSTPTETKMCTGIESGMSFSNCPATVSPLGAFASNATFTGYASGAGPGSATPGKSYTVTVNAVFTDGSSATDTFLVEAASGTPNP